MKHQRLLNEYIIDDIFKVRIYRSYPFGNFLIIIVCTESGQYERFENIESVPTFEMIENLIKQKFNYGN